MTRAGRGLAALALLAFALAGGARAADEPEGWAYEVWNELMSPYCPGRTLAECPSGQAEQLRLWILVQEAAGRSRADVEAEIFERFGDVVLAAPRATGFGITAYAIPIVAFAAGGVLVALFLRRQTRARPSPLPAGPIDPALERAIDEELRR